MGENDLRLAHLVAVTADRAAVLRRDPAALASLREGSREETGLGPYGHAIQCLLAGRAEGVRGPLAWLTGDGEELEKKHGAPLVLPPELAAAAGAWEAWWAKQAGAR